MSNIIPGALSSSDPTCVLTVCGRIAAQVDCIKYIMQGTSACIDVQFFNIDGSLLDLDNFCNIQIQLTNEYECVVANFWYPSVPTGSRGFDINILQYTTTSGHTVNKGLLRICLSDICTLTSPGAIFVEILLKECLFTGEDLPTPGTITKTFNITVVNDGTANVFVVDNVNKPVLNLIRSGVYILDQSDVTNTGHQIAFKDNAGISYTSGIVTTGVPGQAGAQTVFTVPANAPNNLRYYCVAHGNYMGNAIMVTTNGSQTGDSFGVSCLQIAKIIESKIAKNGGSGGCDSGGSGGSGGSVPGGSGGSVPGGSVPGGSGGSGGSGSY